MALLRQAQLEACQQRLWFWRQQFERVTAVGDAKLAQIAEYYIRDYERRIQELTVTSGRPEPQPAHKRPAI